MISFNSISILSLSLELNLKSYMDILLIWGAIYPQNIILPFFNRLASLCKLGTKFGTEPMSVLGTGLMKLGWWAYVLAEQAPTKF